MFVVVESGGLQSAYIPGRFRPRTVAPVEKIHPVDHVDEEGSQHSHSRRSPQDLSVPIRAYEAVKSMSRSGRSAILATEVMSSPVVSLPAETRLLEAQNLIRQRRFRHVPVTTENGNVIGILSDRDVWRGLADPTAYRFPPSTRPGQAPIHQFMRQPVLMANPSAEVRAIAKVMFEEHIGAMPIVDENGTLAGMITRSDILRVLISHPDFDHWV